MKGSLFVLACCLFMLSCQREDLYRVENTMDTRDSLVGRWDFLYTYKENYSDSTFTARTDSNYDGDCTPFSFLYLFEDSTYRWFMSQNQVPPIYGFGYSGRWRYDPARRLIYTSTEIWSGDTGWVNTQPHPPPNGLRPLYYVKLLGADSMVLFIRGIHSTHPRYTRTNDVYRRRR